VVRFSLHLLAISVFIDFIDITGVMIIDHFFQLSLYLRCSLFVIVTATLVSKANASGNQEDVQDAVSQALVVGILISLVGCK